MSISDRIQNYLIKSGKRAKPTPKPAKVEHQEEWTECKPTIGEWVDENKIKITFVILGFLFVWVVSLAGSMAVLEDWNRCHLSKECREWMKNR